MRRALVAVTEKYFSPCYFDKALTGARADQNVLQDIIRQKLPIVFTHLSSIDVELSTICLNWFLAVFYDVVPFQVKFHVRLFTMNESLK
jgi:TBC1 domain family member 2B